MFTYGLSRLDVYGENARKIVPIDSPQFGRVFAVCVGAMMVGSIVTTVEEGTKVARGDEFGYFAFGTFQGSSCTRTISTMLILMVIRRLDDCALVREGHGTMGRGLAFERSCLLRDACSRRHASW